MREAIPSRMSSIFPPMISSSPPPINNQTDDEEEEDDFGDFRVADLSLKPHDSTSRSSSPDSPFEEPLPKLIPEPLKPLESSSVIPCEPNELCTNSIDDLGSPLFTTNKIATISDENCIKLKGVELEEKELKCDWKSPDLSDDSDCIEVTQELEKSVCSSFKAPLNCELRTSPEGADSDADSISESNGFELASDAFYGNDDLKTDPTNTSKAQVNDDDDEFCEFADFSSHELTAEPPPLQEFQKPESGMSNEASCDVFNSKVVEQVSEPLTEIIDDFDDFEFAEPPPYQPPLPSFTSVAEDKVADIFPNLSTETVEDVTFTGCLNSCLDDSSSVWGHLKDLELSHALTLQWSNSSTSKKLLSSLNVDSRNILIGSRFNSSVPRFAANMSCAPLEPMKAENTDPTLPHTSRAPIPGVEDVVPAAQFDWNSSGLTNPLDCLEKEEKKVHIGAQELKESALFSQESPLFPGATPSSDESPSEEWTLQQLPSTDVLLPSPVGPLLTGSNLEIPEERNIPASLSLEDWLGNSKEETLCELKVDKDTVKDLKSPATWTISSQLEKVGDIAPKVEDQREKKKLSAEACRVVDALPDLSFLSARKLLYAANENISRFNTTHH